MENYFKFKIVMDYIIPLVIVVLFVIISLLPIIISPFTRVKRLKRFFQSHGYERCIVGYKTSPIATLWGWRRVTDGKQISDRDLKDMSVREIRREYR